MKLYMFCTVRLSIISSLFTVHSAMVGRAVAWWLRLYATNQQVAGSISVGVSGIFQ
jgi:hypothetical protein